MHEIIGRCANGTFLRKWPCCFDLVCAGGVYLLEQRNLTSNQNMARRLGICLTCVVIAASSHSASPGANAGLYGDVVAHSDYTLNLQPPEESTHDVEVSLDTVMKAEDEKRILSDTDFCGSKAALDQCRETANP